MSEQRHSKGTSKDHAQRQYHRRRSSPTPADQEHGSTGTLPSTQEQVLALSRTAAGVQSLLDPDRIFEAIGDELRDQDLSCFFGLLEDSGGKVVLRHTNLSPETIRHVEAVLGAPMLGHEFGSDASPHIQAVVRDAKTTLDRNFAHVIGEIFLGPAEKELPRLVELLRAHEAISAPLLAGCRVLGILTVWSERLTEEDLPSISVLAQQAAVALERADLYEDAMRRVFEMEALRKTTLDMTRQLDLPQLLRLIVERAAALIGTKGGALYLYRPEKDDLELVVSLNLGKDYSGTHLQAGEGLSGRVLLTGQPLAIEDYSNWQNHSSQFDGIQLGGVLAVPLKWGDNTIGVLNVTDGPSPRSFDERDLWLLEWFANHAAVAIENAHAFSETERKIQQLGALHETSLELLAETDHSRLLLKIVQKAVELLDAQAGAIDLFDAESQRLEMQFSHGYRNDYSGIRLSPGQGVAGKVCETKQPFIVDNYAIWPDRVPQVDEDEISSALGVPLLRSEELLGVLTIDRSEPFPFNEDDVQLATLFANQAVLALENARLYHEQERRSQELLALHETSLHVVSRLELSSLLTAIIGRAVQLLEGESGDIYLYRPDTQDLISAASHQMPAEVHGVVVKAGEGLSGTILETRRPLIVDDYESWPGRSESYAGYGFAHVVGVPITYGDQFLGAVVVERGRESPSFTERDQGLLTLFAHQAAVAIENSRLYEETKHTAEELEALYDISTEIATQLELPALLNTIVRRALDLFDAWAGGLYLLDPATQELELIAALGHTRDRRGIRLAPGEGVCGKVAQSGEPLVVRDYRNWEGRSPHFDDEPTCNVLAVPIKHGESLVGAFFVDDSNLDRVFGERDLRLATLLANQAAVAIHNARLFAERERTIEQLSALQKVSLEVVAKTDLSEVLPTIVRVAADLLDAEAGAIDLFDPETQDLELTTVYGYDTSLLGMKHAWGEGVVGEVARTKAPLIVKDYAQWPGRSPQWHGTPIGTVLGIPLLRADQLLGVLTIDRTVVHPFDESDLKLATLFASQAAIAIENARTVAATVQRVSELAALREISLQLTHSLDLATVLDTIVTSAVRLVQASDAHIFLCDEARDEFVFGSGAWAPGQAGLLFTEVREDGLTATVAKRAEPVVINDARSHPLFRDVTDEDNLMEAIAGFPLKRGNKVLGVFNVAFLEPHTFDHDELRVLTLLADQAAIAIENARLYEETDRRLKESQTLQETSRLISSSLEPAAILQTVVETLASTFGYDMTSIYTREEDRLRLGAEEGYDPEAALDFIPLNKGVIGRVARSGEAEFLLDVSGDPDFLAAAPGIVSEIAVPIKKDHEVLGVLNVESTTPSALTKSDLTLLSSLAHQVSVAIQNAQLYQAAQRELVERKRAEEAYRAVVDHSLQGILVLQDNRIVIANHAAADIVGCSPDELLALSPEQVRDLVHPDDQALVWGRFRERLTGKAVPPRYEYRAVRKDGSVIWVEMFANLVEHLGQPAIQGAIIDITERKRAEEALRQSEEKFRSLFEDSRDPVYITTRAGAFVNVNDSFLALFGLTRDELARMQASDLYARPEDRTRFLANMQERGAVRDYELQLKKSDGTIIDALLSTTLWRSDDGETLGYQGIIHDMTERKRAQDQLQQSYRAVRTALGGTVKALAALGEIRDPYTAGHQQRVSWLACAIAEDMGLPRERIQGLRWAGLVHDIGKIQVPAEILSKPTSLTDVEMQMIRAHPRNAYNILCTVEFPWPVADIVLQHHERLDGSGYPKGLVQEQILREARILAVADVVEAMASDRPYRPAHSLQETMEEIASHAGILYDADVVQAFMALLKDANFDLSSLTSAPRWFEE
jgi:PAS domain S-box-containing protein